MQGVPRRPLRASRIRAYIFCSAPAFAHLRLALHQVGLHREAGLGQVQRITIIMLLIVRHSRVLKSSKKESRMINLHSQPINKKAFQSLLL